MIKRLIYTVILMAMCLFTACNDELDKRTTLTFIGDSIIARWDLQQNFSSYATTNLGKSGAGIDYIESLHGTMHGRNIVVMIGTNNWSMMAPETRDEYADRYLNAILALNAERIYLYSVLPRNFGTESADTNDYIQAFNSIIKSKIVDYKQIVYLDVYDEFIDVNGNIKPELYNDGLHLSFVGYEILSNKLSDLF